MWLDRFTHALILCVTRSVLSGIVPLMCCVSIWHPASTSNQHRGSYRPLENHGWFDHVATAILPSLVRGDPARRASGITAKSCETFFGVLEILWRLAGSDHSAAVHEATAMCVSAFAVHADKDTRSGTAVGLAAGLPRCLYGHDAELPQWNTTPADLVPPDCHAWAGFHAVAHHAHRSFSSHPMDPRMFECVCNSNAQDRVCCPPGPVQGRCWSSREEQPAAADGHLDSDRATFVS
ncbi:hypothetical protein BC831DRAFT_253386 [Entophlyctis helioformis]|nr:hypothetical protein BC831DRAFT_253386 [Entophlyctis helioformis]